MPKRVTRAAWFIGMRFVKQNAAKIAGMALAGASLCLVGGLAAGTGSRSGSGDCCRCHEDVCRQSTEKRYVHAPVLEEKCAVCHVDPAGTREDSVSKKIYDPDQITWLAKDFSQSMDHWFRLEPDYSGNTLIIRAEGGAKKFQQIETTLPDFASLPEIHDDHLPPSISDVRVKGVSRGVLLSATIGWRTDEAADSAVAYGQDDLGNMSPVDTTMTRDHEVVLTGLEPDQTYRFAAVARDMFGNESRSPEFTLSTARVFGGQGGEQSESGRAGGQLTIEKQIDKLSGQYLIRVSANHPVTTMLGIPAAGEKKESLKRTNSVVAEGLPEGHAPLSDPYMLTTKVCFTCHPETEGILSHPIDVYPKNGMLIPPDYRTLPDGRLSCMSCHMPHASDYEYRITRPSKKALCLGCHRNFG